MTKNKHDHTATKKIKTWLFAIMLLLPFLFLLPTGLYYGLNQNANTQIIEEQMYFNKSNPLEEYSYNSLEQDTIYYMDFNTSNNNNNNNTYDIYPNYLNVVSFNSTEILIYEDNNIYELYIDDTNHLTIYDGTTAFESSQDTLCTIIFVMNDLTTNDYQVFCMIFNPTIRGCNLDIRNSNNTYTINNDISTSIINAWNSTWQNPLFSWTNYSPFYAPMQNFTNVFGINNMQIANVLTYLATITAIYIVFDIIIELFTYLTHLIPRSD